MLRFWIAVAAVVVADQMTKLLIQNFLQPWETYVIIPKILALTYVQNPGGAFGILASQEWVLLLFTFAAVSAAILFRHRIIDKGYLWELVLILGGGLGNLLDRLQLGYVVDFIDFHFWPVFNIADIAIVTGVILLFLNVISSPCRGVDDNNAPS
ncbi:MAG: signal peptidase II [Peptococcaceae bacterium]|nr:signal peptidase II [Peptococcaceae bacterium]